MRAFGGWVAASLLFAMVGCERRPESVPKAAVHPAVAEAQAHFTFKGQPIPPYFVTDFSGGPDANDYWTAPTGSRISAVVVQGFFEPMESYNDYRMVTEKDGFILIFTEDGGGLGPPRFGYRFLGTTPSGVTVLKTYGSTGGSGVFLGVMFVRFEMETVGATKEEKQERLVMRFLDQYMWGDRVYREVKLTGNTLWLGPTNTDIPAYKKYVEPERTVVIE